MGYVKANGFVATRKLIKAKGQEAERTFLDKLTPEEQEYYHTAICITKMSLEEVVKYSNHAVPILFPDLTLEKGLIELGRASLREDMNGIYRLLLRIVTPDIIIKRAAGMWSNLHSHGRAKAINTVNSVGECSVDFIIEDYPDMPIGFLYILDGYVTALASLTTKSTMVSHDFSNKDRWSWKVKWFG